jgi:hypothetical protein
MCNTEEMAGTHCCSLIAINITYSQYVSVALVIQHGNRMTLFPVWFYNIFPY